MPALQFGLSSYERAEGDLPELPVVNLFAEEAPSEGKVVLQSRHGLVDRSAGMGFGPVRQLFQRDLVLNSGLYGVSGSTLYSETTALGAIDGTGPVSMAGWETLLFVAAGGGLWSWDGTTLSQIAFPDGAGVIKVLVGASRLIAIRADTGKFYWTPVLGNTVDGQDFATAESQPDRLLDMVFIDDMLILGGAETIEFWPNTGDPNLPFRPLEGQVIDKGVKATGCLTTIGPTFAFASNENKVHLGNEGTVISNPGLEGRIAASSMVSLFTFLLGGDQCLALRLDEETQIWNLRTGTWHEFASYGQTNWVPQCFAGGIFGSSIDGRTLEFGEGYQDLGGVLERRLRGGFPLNSGGLVVGNVQVRSNVGQTPFLTGDYAEPLVEMRVSRDAGQTWGSWRSQALGVQGQYRRKVQWRSCGMASQPGFLAEFRVTDPVPFRVSDVLINEQYGGR